MRKNSKEKIYGLLFKGNDQKLDPTAQRLKDRYERIFCKWLDDPALRDLDMRNFIQKEFSVSYTQSHRDLEVVKFMLGNVSNAAKEWQRYMAIDMIKKGYELVTKEDGDRLDIKRGLAMIKAGEAIGKVTKLDKEDPEPIPYDDIVPQSFEPTGDVSVLGMKKIPQLKELQARLRKKYGSLIEEAKVIAADENEKSIL
ncbi:MAG: hypothetical protein UY18_C0036G0006 [Microgenomates group bacterium GW2011_GWF2_47_9]|nr:MAG: hypothetical protein UY18_C0036G0006 [Microgenomates group bacterium GW2011_GWF2_47_9]